MESKMYLKLVHQHPHGFMRLGRYNIELIPKEVSLNKEELEQLESESGRYWFMRVNQKGEPVDEKGKALPEDPKIARKRLLGGKATVDILPTKEELEEEEKANSKSKSEPTSKEKSFMEGKDSK